MRLSSFRFFRHRAGSYTLWLEPESEGRLEALQARLLAVAPDCGDVLRHGRFQPHLSVGQFRGGDRELQDLLRRLEEAWIPLAFSARAVSLIWRGDPPDDVFRVDRTFALSGPADSP